jgi:hypothetical protein
MWPAKKARVHRMTKFGYSGKTLSTKLGLKSGQRMLVIGAPRYYAQLIAPLPEGASLSHGAWGGSNAGYDTVHAFFPNRATLAKHRIELVGLPSPGGAIWVSWPKKSSALFSDLTDKVVRELLLPTGWVDVKVAAVDGDWSGLKFLRRTKSSSGPSRFRP